MGEKWQPLLHLITNSWIVFPNIKFNNVARSFPYIQWVHGTASETLYLHEGSKYRQENSWAAWVILVYLSSIQGSLSGAVPSVVTVNDYLLLNKFPTRNIRGASPRPSHTKLLELKIKRQRQGGGSKMKDYRRKRGRRKEPLQRTSTNMWGARREGSNTNPATNATLRKPHTFRGRGGKCKLSLSWPW